jgi:hypothetical protein
VLADADLVRDDVGGRWHFSDIASLTFRFGYPTFSLGVSFFL